MQVAHGKDGWLFLDVNKPHHPLRDAADLTRWREQRLPRSLANFVARAQRVQARGLPILVVIAPESSSIYPENLPPDRTVALPSVGEVFAAELASHGIDAICPAPELRQGKSDRPMYGPNDTHWTVYGAYVCYREIMKVVGRYVPAPIVEPAALRFGTRDGYGDLGISVVPERRGLIHTVEIAGPRVDLVRTSNDQLVRSFRHTRFADGKGRLLLYRDSAANALIPFLERSFAEMVAISPSPTMPDDAIDHFRPDIVMLELAESSLFQEEPALADWEVGNSIDVMVELHSSRSAGVAGRQQARAIEALTQGRNADAVAAAAVAAVLGGSRLYASTLAWSLLNANQHQAGYEFTSYLVAGGSERLLHYLHAQFAHHLGKSEEAIWSLSRALALQPNNALYLFALAERQFGAARHAEALAAASRSIRYAPGHLRSWFIAIGSLIELGRHEDAAERHRAAAAIFGAQVSASELPQVQGLAVAQP